MPKLFAYYILIACVLSACGKDENVAERETTAFKSYLDRNAYVNNLPCDSLGGGVWRVLENGDRDGRDEQLPRATHGSMVEIFYEGHIFHSELDLKPQQTTYPAPFVTNIEELIAGMGELGLDATYWSTDPLEVRIGDGTLAGGLERGIEGAYLGDVILVLLTSEAGYGRKPMGMVPQNTPLIFRIYINDVR
jgi:hypothetical protein